MCCICRFLFNYAIGLVSPKDLYADRRSCAQQWTSFGYHDNDDTIGFLNSLESNENKISNGNVEEIDAERMRLRKELADMRKAKQNAEEHSYK